MSNGSEGAVRVEFIVNGDERVWLRPGDVVGRTASAALRIDDPAVSEAHALVSLRGSVLRLLSLRGRFVVAGLAETDVHLLPGVVVELAPARTLEVSRVELPLAVSALRLDGGSALIPPTVASLRATGRSLVPGLIADAIAVIWVSDDGFRIRADGVHDALMRPGQSLVVCGRHVEVVALPLTEAGTTTTELDHRFATPLELLARFDTVHVRRGELKVTIDGMPGRILSELALMGTPSTWRAVAQEVWPEEQDERRLRMNWDAANARLRHRLREAGLRTDLVRSLGAGLFELFLGPHDRVLDQT